MTVPDITRRAVVDAFHPLGAAVAGRMRSSLKTVKCAALGSPRQVVLVGARRGYNCDGSRMRHACAIHRFPHR